jgi:hypothetical protein
MEQSIKPIDGAEYFRVTTDAAGLCRDVVMKTAKAIGNRKFVSVEGWQAIAAAHAAVAGVESVTEDENGNVKAIAVLRRVSDCEIQSKAEGFVGMDERTWSGRNRYARRAMAQTRAISRVCRSAYAHVVTIIDAGLSTTPAEEVPPEGIEDEKGASPQSSKPDHRTQQNRPIGGGKVLATNPREHRISRWAPAPKWSSESAPGNSTS